MLRKAARNEALFKYSMEHPEATFAEIGAEFNISRQRAFELIKNEEKKKETVEVKTVSFFQGGNGPA